MVRSSVGMVIVFPHRWLIELSITAWLPHYFTLITPQDTSPRFTTDLPFNAIRHLRRIAIPSQPYCYSTGRYLVLDIMDTSRCPLAIPIKLD